MGQARLAYLVDPFDRQVTEIDFIDNEPRQWRRLLCLQPDDSLDHAVLLTCGDGHLCCFVDGAGYYRDRQAWWRLQGYHHPLPGRTILYGSGPEGETVDVPVSLDDLCRRIAWLVGRPVLDATQLLDGHGRVIAEIDHNAPDRPRGLEEMYDRLFPNQGPKNR